MPSDDFNGATAELSLCLLFMKLQKRLGLVVLSGDIMLVSYLLSALLQAVLVAFLKF